MSLLTDKVTPQKPRSTRYTISSFPPDLTPGTRPTHCCPPHGRLLGPQPRQGLLCRALLLLSALPPGLPIADSLPPSRGPARTSPGGPPCLSLCLKQHSITLPPPSAWFLSHLIS